VFAVIVWPDSTTRNNQFIIHLFLSAIVERVVLDYTSGETNRLKIFETISVCRM